MKTIAIIIPNYNGSSLILKNLPYVINASDQFDTEIIIVDDGSKPDEVKILEDYLDKTKINHKNITLIKHKINKGFSSAVNTGGKNADAQYLLFLNSDVRPEKDFIQPLLNRFKDNEKMFAVGCMDKSIEGERVVMRGRGIGVWKKGFVLHQKGNVEEGSNTFWVSGGSSMMDAEKWRRLNGFDEIYNPFYWEDIDLSYRAQKAGYEIAFEKKSVVEHRHSEGAIKKHYSKSSVTKVSYRNQFIFIWKNISDRKLLLSHFIYLPIYIARAIISLDTVFLGGFFAAITFVPQIIQKRRVQKKIYSISDKQILFS